MSGHRIIFTQPEGKVAVFYSAPGVDLSEVAERVVPQGIPYWIVPEESIPTDRTHRELWEIDTLSAGEPDGYGTMEVANDQD